jgi:hypoxanthine phosphoribosyltransferase
MEGKRRPMATETIKQTLLTAEEIAVKTAELGKKITEDYRGKNLLVVTVLKGSAIFAADLVRQIDLPLQMDFICTSSYGASTKSSGVVQIVKDIDQDLDGLDVLVVEDIVDTGLTLSYLLKLLQVRNPASLKMCSLLEKPARRQVPVAVDYLGFTIEDHFVVGYGLDYAGRYRNLPYVGVLELT